MADTSRDSTKSDPASRQATLAKWILNPGDASLEQVAPYLQDESPDVRQLAAVLSAEYGEAAVDRLVTRLEPDEELAVRLSAIASIGRIGAPAEPAIPALVICLEDDEEELRWHAVFALSCIGAPAVPPLTEALNHPRTAAIAAEALGRIGEEAKDSQASLEKLAKEGDSSQQACALAALMQVTQSADPHWEALQAASCSDDASERAAAIEQIGQLKMLDEKQEEAEQLLTQKLQDADSMVRCQTALAIARLCREDCAPIEALQSLLQDPVPQVQCHGAMALARFGDQAEPARGELERLADGPNVKVAEMATEALKVLNRNSSP